jgi:CRISPR/Cas system-associated endoribonuclease Cas2
MKKIVGTMTAGIVVVLMSGIALAGPTDDPGIQNREQKQEQRIQQGVQSGQLTPKEAGRLEAQQTKIKQDEERMKADGKLTKAERKKLKREQGSASENIHKKKHNEKTVEVK